MSHIAIVVPSLNVIKNGNFYTVDRIRSYLKNHGYTSVLLDPKSFSTKKEFQIFVKNEGVDLVLGIHAYKSGSLLQDAGSCISVPYILMLGGTDINEYSKNLTYLEVMTKAVNSASKLVVFGRTMFDKTKELWPYIPHEKIKEIRQAVIVKPSTFCLCDYLTTKHLIESSRSSTVKIFLTVGGIRPVKDPIYLFDVFSEWHKLDDTVFLVVIGPKVDVQYYEHIFLPAVDRANGVIFLSELSLPDAHAVIKESFALVNSSRSEGMSLAILEAMKLKTLVFARDVPGNLDLIKDEVNGIIYKTPQDFYKKAQSILNNPEMRKTIVSRGYEFVNREHNPEDEENAYLSLISECLHG